MTNSKDDHLLAPQYYKGLSQLGVKVHGSYYLDLLNKKVNKSQRARIQHRFFPSSIYKELNKLLIHDVKSFEPDLVWIFKGMEIFPKTLDIIRERGIYLVNYNLDHPFRFISRGSGNSNVRNSILKFNLHISYSQEIIRELNEKFYGIRTCHLPFGYPDLVEDLVIDKTEVVRACFVGHADDERAKVIQFISNKKIDIDVFGPDWTKYLMNSRNIRIHNEVKGKDYWKVLKKYRVQLNILRSHNCNSHNMRTFEIPAVGGIMLADYTQEQANYFEPGKEAFYYGNPDELIANLEKLLSLSEVEADQIRTNARKRSIDSKYSYSERSKQVLQEFNKVING